MVKKLFDWCLDFIASNLNTLPKVGNNLATVHKELILDRIVKHDMLAPTYIPHVTQHLLTPAIKNINLYRCDQVDDNFLAKVGKSGCQLRSLTVHQCEKVTGEYSGTDFLNIRFWFESSIMLLSQMRGIFLSRFL